MALLEKIAGIHDPGTGMGSKISPSWFWATFKEIIRGEITPAQAATFWNNKMGLGWDSTDDTDLTWLIDQYNSTSTNKEVWLADFLAILQAIEAEAPGYLTDADLKARIQRI